MLIIIKINKINLIIIFILFLINCNNAFIQTKLDCKKAPDNQTKLSCNNMINAMNNFKNNRFYTNKLKDDDIIIDRSELNCVNLSCYCSYLGGISNGSINDCTLKNGQKVKKAIRKELRMLTDKERIDIFKAIREMKNNGDYDYMAKIHRRAFELGSVHGGPAFLPWHLEYIKRKRNPTIGLPYWDSTLESRLAKPSDSFLFTDDFYGTTNSKGFVVTGPFSPWKTLEGIPYITRNVGKEDYSGLFSVQWTLSQTKIENIMAYTIPGNKCPFDIQWNCPEIPHGKIHSFISGDMNKYEPNRAVNDIVFFFHHSFINLIFESWRQKHQTREQRANDYPADIIECEPSSHFRNATMTLFSPLRNIDGLRNEYNDNMYEYSPRPNCTFTKECESKYLFCDLSHSDSPHCAAKVRLGGNCKGFTKGDVCMNSKCVNDICVII